MRVRDWLADHFRFVQYSKPRKAAKREPSRLIWFAVEFVKTAAVFTLGAVVLLARVAEQMRPRRGEPPVAPLFLAALFAALSGAVFSFLL